MAEREIVADHAADRGDAPLVGSERRAFAAVPGDLPVIRSDHADGELLRQVFREAHASNTRVRCRPDSVSAVAPLP